MAKYEIKDGVGIIPEGTTKIEDHAFDNCAELTSITIPDTALYFKSAQIIANLHIFKLTMSR